MDGCPAPVFSNVETHWWDGSQIYGSGRERQAEVRTFVDGKIKVGDDGRLPKSDIPGIDLTGMRENWWVRWASCTRFSPVNTTPCAMP